MEDLIVKKLHQKVLQKCVPKLGLGLP